MTLPSPQSCSNRPGHCASITVFPDFLCVTSHTHIGSPETWWFRVWILFIGLSEAPFCMAAGLWIFSSVVYRSRFLHNA